MRMRRQKGSTQCSGCGGERDRPGQRYCSACNSEYQKAYRLGERRPPAVRMHLKRGALPPQPCCPVRSPCDAHRPKKRRAPLSEREIDHLAKKIAALR